jgi:hypothetical protein
MIGKEKYFETTTPSRDVFGQFNGHMSDSFLVNFDELSKKEMLGAEGQFKALTTNPGLTINEKGVKSYKIQSYHRFIITSNSEDPISSSKNDRRNLIIRSSDKLVGDKAYFEDLYALLEDVNAMKSCYEYLKAFLIWISSGIFLCQRPNTKKTSNKHRSVRLSCGWLILQRPTLDLGRCMCHHRYNTLYSLNGALNVV